MMILLVYFIDVILLSVMIGISWYVKDFEIKKIFKEIDGLGIEVIWVGIFEFLFKCCFLEC